MASATSLTIPNLPAEVVRSSGIYPAGDGLLTRALVIRKLDGYSPYVVHGATLQKGEWSFFQGDYCATLEEATERFEKRLATFR